MTKTAPPPTVFVVDDDEAMRDSLAWLIESVSLDVKLLPDAQSFLDSYNPSHPGCLVLDVRMPGMSGLALQQELIRREVKIPVIFVTAHGDVPMAVRAVKHGALDFFEKPFSQQEFLEAIRAAIAEDARRRMAASRQHRKTSFLDVLSPRETEVLEQVVKGQSSREVAKTLGISPRTVEVHRAHIMEKTGAGSVAELVQMSLDADSGNRKRQRT